VFGLFDHARIISASLYGVAATPYELERQRTALRQLRARLEQPPALAGPFTRLI